MIELIENLKRKTLIKLTKKRPESVLRAEIKDSLTELNIDLEYEETRFNVWAIHRGEASIDLRVDSVHPLILAGLIASRFENGRMLEFGTYDGRTCNFLAQSFSNLVIDTIDLPTSDPLLRGMYDRGDNKKFVEFKKRQDANVACNNINYRELNTMFFGSSELATKKYDLIWLDAGHNYPEVAWDFSNALSVLVQGGALVIDDVIPLNAKYTNEYVSTDSWELIKYLEKRQSVKITKVLKRVDNVRYRDPQRRKYVVIIELQ